MRVMLWTIAAVCLALATASAVAQDSDDEKKDDKPKPEAKVHEPAPEIEAKFDNADGGVSLERHRGRIVLLFFFKSTDPASVEALTRLSQVHKDFGDKGVVVIGLTPEDKQKAEGVVTGKQAPFIVGYEANTKESYKVSAFPLVYMIDTEGVLTDRFHPEDRLTDRLQGQIVKTPPPGMDTKTVRTRLMRAMEAKQKKEYGRAYTIASEIRKVVDTQSEEGKSVGKLVDELEEAAKRWLDEAKEAAKAEKHEDASRILAELSTRFADLDVARDAQDEIGRMMGNRAAKPVMKKALDNAKGLLLNDKAADNEAARRYSEALRLYRESAEEYPETEAGQQADARIKEIRANTEAVSIITQQRAKEVAERWLDVAERFRKVNMFGKAREFYERVIETHPETRAASKAKERLADLPEPEADEVVEPEPPAEDATTKPATQPAK